MISIVLIIIFTFSFQQVLANDSIIISQMEGKTKYYFAVDMQLLQKTKKTQLQQQLNRHLGSHKLKDVDFSLNDYDEGVDSYKNNFSRQQLKKINIKPNYCYNGQQKHTQQDKLKAFKQGPCSPVILVPGILGTALVVSIDCQELFNSKQGSIIFKKCGWTKCNSILGQSPAKNYLLWVGLNLMTKGSLKQKNKDCLGTLLSLKYNYTDKSDNFLKKYYEPPGVKSTWFGNNHYTSKKSNCGANAIADLAGVTSVLKALASQCAIKGYKQLISVMQMMGYISGITFQPIPYDFRYSILSGITTQIIPQAINNLYYTTGKKVILIGHSLGTLHLLQNLAYHIKQITKNKMIRQFIPIAPPFFGTGVSFRNLISGDQSYWTKTINVGVSFQSQASLLRTAGGAIDLIIKDAFLKYRNETWIQQILKRIEYQNTKSNQQLVDYPLSWYPGKNYFCFDWYYKTNPRCKMGFIDTEKTPILKVNGTSYYANQHNITKLFNTVFQQQTAKVILQIWNQTKSSHSLYSIPSPNVNTTIIYSTLFPTPDYFQYQNYNVETYKTVGGNFHQPNITKSIDGDGSVPAYSPLVFATKWILQGNNNHTVKLVEYCSNYKGPIKQHYQSLKCKCLSDRLARYTDCLHSCIISEIYTINFLINKMTNNKKGYNQQGLKDAVYLSQNDIQMRHSLCPNLQPYNKITPQLHSNKNKQ